MSTIVVVALGILWFTRSEGPVYKGRTLEAWLRLQDDAAAGSPAAMEAQAAVVSIGTNALPYALRWIMEDDEPTEDDQFTRPVMGRRVFSLLGPQAAPAVPALTKLTTANSIGAFQAVCSLADIGPAGIPTVLSIITNKSLSTPFRSQAINCLRNVGTNSPMVVATLLECLDDSEKEIAFAANTVLFHDLKYQSPDSLAVLLKMLSDPDVGMRLHAMKGIADYRGDKSAAIPELAKLLKDENPRIRWRVARLLQRLSPNTSTNTPAPASS